MARFGASLAAFLMAVVCMASGARAQDTTYLPLPEHVTDDANGVNLVTGALDALGAGLSIGQPPAGGLSRSFSVIANKLVGGQVATIGTIDNFNGQIVVNGSTYTVSVGSSTESFTQSGSTFSSASGSGSTLVQSGSSYIYTTSDGSQATFQTFSGSSNGNNFTDLMISKLVKPSGEVLTFNGGLFSRCVAQCSVDIEVYALTSIFSNRGYQINYGYVNQGGPSNQYPLSLSNVTMINSSVDYCPDGYNNTCTLTRTWPTQSFSGGSATDALNQTTTYVATSPGSGGTVITVTMPAGVKTTYTLNASQQVTSVSNGIGTWTYGYALSGTTDTTTVTDPNGHTRVVVGDTGTGLVASDTDGLGRKTSYAYDSYGRMISMTRPEGDIIKYGYDAGTNVRGNITSITHVPVPGAQGANTPTITTTAGYSATCGNPVTCNQPNYTKDALGNETDYTYDPTHGGVTSVTSPAGPNGIRPQTRYSYSQIATYAKNSSGALAQSGAIWSLTGISSCMTGAAGAPNSAGTGVTTPACVGTADETRTIISYAGSYNAQPTSVTTQSGDGLLVSTTSTTYDIFGNVQTVQGPLGPSQTVQYFYDADREMTGMVAPNPGNGEGLSDTALRYTYNGDGQPILIEQGTVTDQTAASFAKFASAVQQAIGYDSAGRKNLTSVASGGTIYNLVQYGYDNANNLQCTAVRMGNLTAPPAGACALGTTTSAGPDRITYNNYDAANELTSTINGYGTSSASTYASYWYNPNGEVQYVTDANNNRTTYYYDGLDRLGTIRYPVTTLGANASDANDYESVTSFDLNGHPLNVRRRDGNTITSTYDNLGRLATRQTPVATTYLGYDNLGRTLYARYNSATGPGVSATYDALGRTKSATSAAGTLSYQYDAAGNRTRITWPDNFFVAYVYDYLNRVTQIQENGASSGAGLLASYVYDGLGNRRQILRAGGAGAATVLNYDAINRMSGLSQNLSGSPGGVQWSPPTAGATPYNAANQLTGWTITNNAYSYSPPASNRTATPNGLNQYASVAGVTYSYDARGNLLSDGVRNFTYDIDNRLLTASAPTPVTLAYDPLNRLQTSTANGTTTSFLYDGAFLAGEYNGSTLVNRYVPGPGTDEPLVWYQGSGTANRQWLHADPHGSIIAWTNASGATGAGFGYGPYGEPNTWTGSRYRYTGQIAIPEAQLYYYKARAYDPSLGRFLQTDPIGYQSDMNAYAYTGNDPINRSDPSGLFTGSDSIDLGGGCILNEDFWGSVSVDDDGTIVDTGYHSFSYSGSCGGGASGGSNGGDVGGGGGGKTNPTPKPQPQPKPQSPQVQNPCSSALHFADGLDQFATYTQRIAGTIALASLAPQVFGGPLDPVADAFTGAGEVLAGTMELSSLAAQGVSGIIHLANGNAAPLTTTVMTAGLGTASGLTGPALHIANTVAGEVGSTINQECPGN